MKILQLIRELNTGGAEKFTIELSNEMARKHSVVLCSFHPVSEIMWLTKKLNKSVQLFDLKFKKKYSLHNLIFLFKLVYKEKPDVVHIHSSFVMLYFLWIIPFYKKIVFVHTVHNTLTSGYKKTFDFLTFFSFLLKKLTNVCLSESILKVYRNKYPNLKFVYIKNGIESIEKTEKYSLVKREVSKYKKNENTKVFISISNYSDYKNTPVLVRVFKSLEKDDYNVILIVIGEDKSQVKKNYRLSLEQKGNNSYLIGLKINVSDYLFCSDAFIMSSTKEGMPLSILEAMSVGLPILSTPAGGIIDLVEDGKNGFITAGFSENDLEQIILKYLDLNKEDLEIVKKNNIKKFNSLYSIKTTSKNYLNLYKNKM